MCAHTQHTHTHTHTHTHAELFLTCANDTKIYQALLSKADLKLIVAVLLKQ